MAKTYTTPMLILRGDVVRETLACSEKNTAGEVGNYKPQIQGSVGFYL